LASICFIQTSLRCPWRLKPRENLQQKVTHLTTTVWVYPY